MARRWDSGYGKPQDPLPKDIYNVTDEEKKAMLDNANKFCIRLALCLHNRHKSCSQPSSPHAQPNTTHHYGPLGCDKSREGAGREF